MDLAPGTLSSLSLQVVNISRHSYSGCVSSSWQGNKYEDQLSDQDKGLYRWLHEHVQNVHILKFLLSQILHQLMSENVFAEDHTGSL